jgi:hypothetical protein
VIDMRDNAEIADVVELQRRLESEGPDCAGEI